MAWVKFINKYSKDNNFVGCSVSKTGLSISRKAYEKVNKPERIDVFYDAEKKAIKLVSSKSGRKVAKNESGYAFLPVNISSLMSLGKYEYTQDNIFISLEAYKGESATEEELKTFV